MRHAQAKEEFVPSADHADLAIAELADRRDGDWVTIGGIVEMDSLQQVVGPPTRFGGRKVVQAPHHLDVFPAGELGMEARADLQQRADPAMDLRPPLRGLGDARNDL